MEIPSNDTTVTTTPTDSYNSLQTTSLPDVQTKTVAQAKKILENAGFKCDTEASSESVVVEQVPKPGTPLIKGALIKLYTSQDTERNSVEVPNVKGLTGVKAKNNLIYKKLNVKIIGSGKVISQDPIPGTKVEEGSVVTITLQDELESGSH